MLCRDEYAAQYISRRVYKMYLPGHVLTSVWVTQHQVQMRPPPPSEHGPINPINPTKPTSRLIPSDEPNFEFQKNILIRAGFCQQPLQHKAGVTQQAQEDLPIFVFVAAVEGSGHHALKSVWKGLQKAGQNIHLIVYDQVFHSFGIENLAAYHYSSIRQDIYLEHMSSVFEQAKQNGSIVIDAQNSYPMGKGAGPLAHPDLLMLNSLDGILFDLRVIVMYRNPVDAALSAVRRFQNSNEYLYKNIEFQARMMVESYATINNALPQLGCGKYMVVDYEKLLANPMEFIKPFSHLLGVPNYALKSAFSTVVQREKNPDSPEKAASRKKLQDFFEMQQGLWPLLSMPSNISS